MTFESNRSGTTVGTYILLRQIGIGGMGTVYEAEHCYLRSRWAVKLLRQDLEAEPLARKRFHHEARLAASLRHPNIVDVRDINETETGTIYIVMELLNGEDLGRRLRREGPLPWQHTRPIITQIASALSEAHNRGLIHRDIKPSNCFITDNDKTGSHPLIKLVDFGIAKPKHDTASSLNHLTSNGILLGTAAYMAPEIIQGYEPCIQSDIYSAGIMLFQILTGQCPFTGDNPFQLLTQHVRTPVRRPSELNSLIPQSVDNLVLKMLEKEPQDRFPNCHELAAAISEIHHDNIQLPVPTTTTRNHSAPPPAPPSDALHTISPLDPMNAAIVFPSGSHPVAPPHDSSPSFDLDLVCAGRRQGLLPTHIRPQNVEIEHPTEPLSNDYIEGINWDHDVLRHLVGRYNLEGNIGEGRTGRTYRAYDTLEKRTVCIKILRHRLVQSKSAANHFILEGRAAIELKHANINATYNTLDLPHPVIISQYVPAGTLRDAMEQETEVSWGKIKRRLRCILEGLSHAHNKSAVHGDLKPSNCGFSSAGNNEDIVLLDFSDQIPADRKFLLGTPSYMAPERIDGIRDWRSDIYSTGVILFEMITGRRPFDTNTGAEQLDCHRFQAPPRAGTFVPYLPMSIEVLLQTAMHKSVHSRLQSAASFLSAIEAIDVDEKTKWERTPSRSAKHDQAPQTQPIIARHNAVPPPNHGHIDGQETKGSRSHDETNVPIVTKRQHPVVMNGPVSRIEEDNDQQAAVNGDHLHSSGQCSSRGAVQKSALGPTTVLSELWNGLGPDERRKMAVFNRSKSGIAQHKSPGDVRVFVSFSHDTDKHVQEVSDFVRWLKDIGYSVFRDIDADRPTRDWPDLVGRELLVADYVCCICTYAYRSHFEGEAPTGKGRGVAYEGALIRQEIVLGAGHRARFIPVLFDQAHPSCIPTTLGEGTCIYYRFPKDGDALSDQLQRPTTRRRVTEFIMKIFSSSHHLKEALNPVLPGMIHDPCENIHRLAARITHILLSEERHMQYRILTSLLNGTQTKIDASTLDQQGLVDIVASLQLFGLFEEQ